MKTVFQLSLLFASTFYLFGASITQACWEPPVTVTIDGKPPLVPEFEFEQTSEQITLRDPVDQGTVRFFMRDAEPGQAVPKSPRLKVAQNLCMAIQDSSGKITDQLCGYGSKTSLFEGGAAFEQRVIPVTSSKTPLAVLVDVDPMGNITLKTKRGDVLGDQSVEISLFEANGKKHSKAIFRRPDGQIIGEFTRQKGNTRSFSPKSDKTGTVDFTSKLQGQLASTDGCTAVVTRPGQAKLESNVPNLDPSHQSAE